MILKEIVSFGGTLHMVNPHPQYGTTKGLAIGRIQTLCRMHLRPGDAVPPSGKECQCCQETRSELNALERGADPGPWLRFWGKNKPTAAAAQAK